MPLPDLYIAACEFSILFHDKKWFVTTLHFLKVCIILDVLKNVSPNVHLNKTGILAPFSGIFVYLNFQCEICWNISSWMIANSPNSRVTIFLNSFINFNNVCIYFDVQGWPGHESTWIFLFPLKFFELFENMSAR